MSNAPGKPVSFSRPKVGYFSNRPRIYDVRCFKYLYSTTYIYAVRWLKVKLKLVQVETGRGRLEEGLDSVRQGCCLSLVLFNMYGEYLTKEALEGFVDFKIGGQ